MKRIATFLLALALIFTLSGCKEEQKSAEPFGIGSYDWDFSHVQDETGAIAYCASENKVRYPDAQVLEVTCTEKDGAVLLQCNGQSWTFPYTVYMDGPSGTIYSLTTSDGSVALAQVNIGYPEEGVSKHMLTVAAGTTALYFYEK